MKFEYLYIHVVVGREKEGRQRDGNMILAGAISFIRSPLLFSLALSKLLNSRSCVRVSREICHEFHIPSANSKYFKLKFYIRLGEFSFSTPSCSQHCRSLQDVRILLFPLFSNSINYVYAPSYFFPFLILTEI